MFIQKAEYIEGYQLKVYFTDGSIRTINLNAFLMASRNHMIQKFRNIDLFKQFRVEDGVICWGENEFDLNPINIYKGEYDIKKTIQQKTVKSKKLSKFTQQSEITE